MAATQHLPLPESTDPTRRKIIDAAGEIFASEGFQNATVREICARAGANVASVNYYFRDKAGLYLEVFRQATGKAHAEIADAAAKGGPPETVLRGIVFGMCRRMMASERPSWALRLMAHEMSRPTPALDTVVEEIISPNYQRLRTTLAAILHLPPDHKTTRMCAHSIIAQIIHYVASRPVISKVWPELEMTPENIDMLAEHIYEFSLNSVKKLARKAR
jgi:AcrR family transcriptional regulator